MDEHDEDKDEDGDQDQAFLDFKTHPMKYDASPEASQGQFDSRSEIRTHPLPPSTTGLFGSRVSMLKQADEF